MSGLATILEDDIIQKIRQYGNDIFQKKKQQEEQISYSLTESSNFQQTGAHIPRATKKIHLKPAGQIYNREKQAKTFHTSPNTKRGQSNSVRKRIFSLYNQQKKLQEQKAKIRKNIVPNKKYDSIKPKYLKQEPIMKNLSGYIEKNIYGRMKTEIEHMKPRRSLSRQQRQAKWEQFIKKSNQWENARESSRIRAKIDQNMRMNEQMKSLYPRKQPPKMTVEDCLQKLRRQAQKLKQKLKQHTFEPTLYQTQRSIRKMQKQKQKSKQRRNNKNPEEHTQKKFTIINNPKKQLSFIFTNNS